MIPSQGPAQDLESVRAVILVIAVGVGAVVLLHGMR